MKNQFLKRLKGIIALAVASLMFSQIGLMAMADAPIPDYSYNCTYVGDFDASGSEQLLYNNQKYGFLIYGGSGCSEPFIEETASGYPLYEQIKSEEIAKILNGGTQMQVGFYVAFPSVASAGGKYAKYVIKNGNSLTDAKIISEEGIVTENSAICVGSQTYYYLIVTLGESGHKYVWNRYGAENVTMNALPGYEFLAAKSGSGTQTDPYVLGMELTEVYTYGGDVKAITPQYIEENLSPYAVVGDTVRIEDCDSGYMTHYEIQKYATLEDMNNNENDPDFYTILSYDEINYALDNNFEASFTMPEGHVLFKKMSHQEMLADLSRVARCTVEAKAATCTKSGNIEYVKCPSCGQIFVEEGNTYKEKTLKDVTIPAKGHSYKTVVEPATKNKAGASYDQCVNCRDTKNKTTIYRPVVSLKKTAFTYNGKKQVPTVVVKDTKGKTISKSYYTVKYSNKNSKSIGTYKASVVLNTKYKGTIDLTYTIAPGKITLTKGDVTKNTIAVTWKKSSGATGYEVQYSTDKNFTKGKTKTATVKDKLTYKASKLTGNKTYYLRARSYTTVKNKKVYSDWSTTLKVKTSKK